MQILKRLTSVSIVGNITPKNFNLKALTFWIALSLTMDLNKVIFRPFSDFDEMCLLDKRS